MKLLQLILIISLLSSCSTIGKKNLLYGKCSPKSFACTQFELKEDKTFEYYIYMDVGGGNVVKGNWDYFNGDTLILNTFKQPKISKTYVKGKENTSLGEKVKIRISDFDDALGFANVDINDGEARGSLNEKGIGYFEVKELKSISYSYLGDKKETIEIKNRQLNDIEIFVKDLEPEVVPSYFVDKLVVVTAQEINIDPNSTDKSFKLKRSKHSKKHWK